MSHRKQLTSLNTFFAATSGGDRETAAHIQAAINYTRRRAKARDLADIGTAARRMFNLYTHDAKPAPQFQHCDLRHCGGAPLWLNARIRECLQQLDPTQPGILLVTGLKDSLTTGGKRFSPKVKRDYERCIQLIHRLALGDGHFGKLHIIIL